MAFFRGVVAVSPVVGEPRTGYNGYASNAGDLILSPAGRRNRFVVVAPDAGEELIGAFRKRVLGRPVPYYHHSRSLTDHPRGLTDYLFALPGDPHSPESIFARLRWGGQFVCVGRDAKEMAVHAEAYRQNGGFEVDREGARFRKGLPLFSTTFRYFVARKVVLISPATHTNRFTFDVELVRAARGSDKYVVRKQVPEYRHIFRRLRTKFPDLDDETLDKRSRKLVERVFPVFLTREMAFLQLLQRDLPSSYRHRVPVPLGVEKGKDGLVHKLYMSWLRLGCEPLPHLEFAIQSADLLRVLHDRVGVIHFDLRLDNFVITRDGVGFVDFGSAVRVDEQFANSPMLGSLFDEMKSTSKAQLALARMVQTGDVTSSYLTNAHRTIDKAIDVFYLIIQMRRPHANPDFVDLVDYDSESEEARRLRGLSARILRPKDSKRSEYRSAADLLHGLERIKG